MITITQSLGTTIYLAIRIGKPLYHQDISSPAHPMWQLLHLRSRRRIARGRRLASGKRFKLTVSIYASVHLRQRCKRRRHRIINCVSRLGRFIRRELLRVRENHASDILIVARGIWIIGASSMILLLLGYFRFKLRGAEEKERKVWSNDRWKSAMNEVYKWDNLPRWCNSSTLNLVSCWRKNLEN